MSSLAVHNLVNLWSKYKQDEIQATQSRRDVEDQISKILEINSANEGTVTLDVDNFTVKIVSRLTRKVDSDALQEIAAEHGLSDHLTGLFRWKADLDMKSWKAASPEITNVLSAAITTTAGRPSYSISKEL